MPATAATIWRVPAYLPYLQPPLTDKAVAAAEKKLGYRLPKSYLRILKMQNGGYIRYTLPRQLNDTIAGIGPNYPSLTNFDWQEFQDQVSFPLQGLIPFDGDGHWYLCLDYRKNPKTPSVAYIDVETDGQRTIARSFDAYLRKLQPAIDDELVIENVKDTEAVIALLSAALSVKFFPPESASQGYPVHSGRIGKESDPQWIWLSPNLVPRGFVRPTDDRYAQLKNLMPGQALRYPELPRKSYILSATTAVRKSVTKACKAAGLNARPLRHYLK